MHYTLQNIGAVANHISTLLKPGMVVAFYGDMGSGKTTLIKSICTVLQVTDVVSSPTYAIINEYAAHLYNLPITLYHMDWYRLKGEEALIDAGIEDLINNRNAISFIEWPTICEKLLPANTLKLFIKIDSEIQRTLLINEF